MKAIQVKAPGADFELVQKEIPEPKDHEVLLKVQACESVTGTLSLNRDIFPVCNIHELQATKL
jgi:hypothetical protein